MSTFTELVNAGIEDAATSVGMILAAGGAVAETTEIVADDFAVARLAVVPHGWDLKAIDLEDIRAKHREHPIRKSGSKVVTTVDSFVDYFNKHAEPTAEVWVGRKEVVGVLNAHGGEDDTDGRETRAGWEDHRITLQLKHSPEWLRWTAMSGNFHVQEDFAEFIEAYASEVIDPDSADMLEIASSLEGTTKVEWKSAHRGSDGQRTLRYEETAEARAGRGAKKDEIEIPTKILLRLRPYVGQDPVDVVARFRYRFKGTDLVLGIVIDRQEDILEAAQGDLSEKIRLGITYDGLVLQRD